MRDIKLTGVRVVELKPTPELTQHGCGILYVTLAVLEDCTHNEWRGLNARDNYTLVFTSPEPRPTWGSCQHRAGEHEDCRGSRWLALP